MKVLIIAVVCLTAPVLWTVNGHDFNEEPELLSRGSIDQEEARDELNLLSRSKYTPSTELDKNRTLTERSDTDIFQKKENDAMEILLGRSKWCRRRNGNCRRPTYPCETGYQESPFGRPYCTSKKRRCCYPATCSETEGFFTVPGSEKQCFKYLNDSGRTWDASNTACQEQGLVFAKPRDPVALRKYLVDTFGDTEAWIGARGTGSSVNWIRDGVKINSESSLWWSKHPRHQQTSSSYCLLLLSYQSDVDQRPDAPFIMNPCTRTGRDWYALCELVM